MADSADMADAIQAEIIDIAVRRARNVVLAGISGECDQCEWWMPRLVEGRCAFCRDGRPRPPDWEPPPRPDPVIVTDPPMEMPTMPDTKSITLVATGPVLDKLKAMTADGTPYNRAALSLLEQAVVVGEPVAGAAEPKASPTAAEPLPIRQRIFTALDAVAALTAEALDRPDISAELVAATARADDAEARASSLLDALTADNARAASATDKVAALRAALDA